MSVYDHLQDGERIELQHPPFYLTNYRLLRSDDTDGRFGEVQRIGMTAVERIVITDHRIMVTGVILVVSGVILTLSWAPATAWLAIIAGVAALLMGAKGKVVGHQVVSPRIAESEQAHVAASRLGRGQFREPAPHNHRGEPPPRPGVVMSQAVRPERVALSV